VKQKYFISINQETLKLSIREYAELEKGEFAFICEEIHDVEVFKNAMGEGAKGLVPIVRRPNMYPRQDFGEKIAQGIIELLNDEARTTSTEILVNDIDDFIAAEDDIDPRVVYEDEKETGEGEDLETEGAAAKGDTANNKS
jgi:hypothetical protein